MPSIKICIATPGVLGPSETFIQALIERVHGDVVHIRGNGVQYFLGEVSIADRTRKNLPRWLDRSLNLLPRFAEFRIRKRWLTAPSADIAFSDFFRSERVDVVLAEYGPQAARILPACQMAGVPLVPHFHGFDASRRSTLQEMQDSYRQLFRCCQRVIAVSERMKQDLSELGCNADIIRVLPCAPHPDFFGVLPNYQSRNLVMVGRLTEKKAPHLSLLAFAKALPHCPGLRLRIIGDGDLAGVCRDLIASLHLSEHVEMLGAGDRAMVMREFSNCAMFIQHSVEALSGDREGTPVAVLEAGASALPVVSTFHAGIPDVVIPGETGLLVPEGDVDGMAEAICQLSSDETFAARLGCNARARVYGQFRMDLHIAAVERTLQEAVALHGNEGCRANVQFNKSQL